jgi:hypothetical protein
MGREAFLLFACECVMLRFMRDSKLDKEDGFQQVNSEFMGYGLEIHEIES